MEAKERLTDMRVGSPALNVVVICARDAYPHTVNSSQTPPATIIKHLWAVTELGGHT